MPIHDNRYDIRVNTWCSPNHGNFRTLLEAKRLCTADPSCTMVYEVGGDHQGKEFRLCDKDAEIKTSSHRAVIHIKKSESVLFLSFSLLM